MLRAWMYGMVVALCLAGAAWAQENTAAPSAADRLREAGALKKTSFKQDEETKREILLKTLECYRSVVKEFPQEKAACAEACFRSGEILRGLKHCDEAEAEFQKVLPLDPHGEFAARALKELGHLCRRKEQFDDALAFYRRVLEECPDQKDYCADALTWIGKVHVERKEFDKAREALIGFADRFPEFPDEAIRNIDLAASTYLQEGNAAEASSLLAQWRAKFEGMLGKDPKMDKKIEKALEGMKTPERLKD